MNHSFLLLGLFSLALTSCGLVRSGAQVPARTIQSLQRTIGLGLTATELKESDEIPATRSEKNSH